MNTPMPPASMAETLRSFLHPRVVTMLFYGFSAGVPILLIFSSLGLWLREAGVERSAVTFFSWAALGYSFKFVWAPLIDKFPLPVLTRVLGRRRAWLLVSQLAVMSSIFWMASIDPSSSQNALTVMAFAAIALGFSSATQDIVIDAYRIESAGEELQALMSSTYIAGYRIGMLVAGAGALYIAEILGSTKESYSYSAWGWTYSFMAMVMLVGVATTLFIEEPERQGKAETKYVVSDYLRLLTLFVLAVLSFIGIYILTQDLSSQFKSELKQILNNQQLSSFIIESLRLLLATVIALIVGKIGVSIQLVKGEMLEESYLEPIRDFFSRYGVGLAILLLALIGLYRVSDIVLGVISVIFYQDLGYSKTEIATVVKSFGLFMTLAGGFLGGILSVRMGVIKILLLGGILSAGTNLLFAWLASVGYNIPLLYLVISADNLAAGLAGAAFVAFLSSLTSISFTAMQYAIFSSLMTLLPKVLGGYSGSIVDSMGYENFFYLTTALGVPVLILIILAKNMIKGMRV